MPRFYSKTEKDALKYILKHLPKPTEESKCHLGAQIDGLIRHIDQEILPTRNRGLNSVVNQPLFRYSPTSNSAASQQTPQSAFSISHDTIFDHHKEIRKRQLQKWSPEASSSFLLDDHGNRVWRQRPVSELSSPDRDWDLEDEHDPSGNALEDNDALKKTGENTCGLSPRRVKSFDELPSSRLSAQFSPETLNAGLCEGDGLDYDVDDNPEIASERMNTAFSKWSHARREGIDAVGEVVIGAPTQVHAIIAKRDKKIWSKASRHRNRVEDEEIHQFHEKSHVPGPGNAASHDDGISTGQASTSKQAPEQKEKTPLNRADLIAREKAANNPSILSAPSASQRRSIRYKNKNRKSILPTPAPSTVKQADHQQQQPPQAEPEPLTTDEKKCTVLLLNSDTDYRQTLNLALRNGSLDPKDDSHIESLYQVMSTFGNNLRGVEEQKDEREESYGSVVEVSSP